MLLLSWSACASRRSLRRSGIGGRKGLAKAREVQERELLARYTSVTELRPDGCGGWRVCGDLFSCRHVRRACCTF